MPVCEKPYTHRRADATQIRSSFPTTNDGKIIKATPPAVMAMLVVTLPMMTCSGG